MQSYTPFLSHWIRAPGMGTPWKSQSRKEEPLHSCLASIAWSTLQTFTISQSLLPRKYKHTCKHGNRSSPQWAAVTSPGAVWSNHMCARHWHMNAQVTLFSESRGRKSTPQPAQRNVRMMSVNSTRVKKNNKILMWCNAESPLEVIYCDQRWHWEQTELETTENWLNAAKTHSLCTQYHCFSKVL